MTFPTLRILPLTIGAGALLLAVQISSLWTSASLLASPARAEEAKKPPETAPGEAAHAEAGKDGHTAETGNEEEKDLLANFTPEELEVLYDLAQRREVLDQREAALDAREALVVAADKRMAARVAEMQGLRGSIEALVRQYDDQERKEIESVVKIYESMKPKDAAAILEKLELPLLLSIVDAMKEKKTSAILAAMTPDRARQVTAEMARKKAIDLTSIKDTGNPG
jgi:flagellar motility protein MotE (MotC chaperone)